MHLRVSPIGRHSPVVCSSEREQHFRSVLIHSAVSDCANVLWASVTQLDYFGAELQYRGLIFTGNNKQRDKILSNLSELINGRLWTEIVAHNKSSSASIGNLLLISIEQKELIIQKKSSKSSCSSKKSSSPRLRRKMTTTTRMANDDDASWNRIPVLLSASLA